MKQLFSRDKWSYVFHTVSHPADGYYEIRHRERGSVPIAVLLVVLFSFSFSINRTAASFIVNDVDPLDVNALTELISVLLLYLLFCVGNWSITCLMEGEGRLKDIAIAIGYAMVPMIVCFNLATILSQFVAQNEEAFYFMVLGIGIAYGLFMILIGIMQVHNYTLGKTMVTILLTFISMFIIILWCCFWQTLLTRYTVSFTVFIRN